MYYDEFLAELNTRTRLTDYWLHLNYVNSGVGLLDRINSTFYVGVDPVNPDELESQEVVTRQNEEIMETQNVERIEENLEPLEPIIPENSKTILMNEFTSRFNDAIWYKKIQEKSVLLAGAGGIGSYVGYLLSRLKIRHLSIWDPDVVEAVNMSGQFYPIYDIGMEKVNALGKLLIDFSDFYAVDRCIGRYTYSSPAEPIMICGFDNMEARKVFFDNWLNYVKSSPHPEECLFIDGRLAAEEFQVLSIQGNDIRAIKEYQEKWLFSDAEAEETVCSYKQTTFMANMIASYMVNVFVNFVANNSDPAPILPRDIPFFISYSADTMFTKVEL